jgi:hypothetical protein
MHIRRASQPRIFAIATVVLALLLEALPAASSPRTWQPLVLKGAQVSQLCNRPIDKLEVLAAHGASFEPIPFQVDQVNPGGAYALPEGPEPIRSTHPNVLMPDDEIVMMISDLGERAPIDAPLTAGAVEIEVTDPLGGPPRYAYADAQLQPRLSRTRYVAYDAKTETIETNHYRLGLLHGFPNDYSPQTHMNEHGPNLIDRFKIRVSARVLKLFTFRVNEDDVQNRLLAWHAGPIRLVRKLSHSVHVVFGISSPEVANYDFLYRDSVENPFKIRFPWVPRLLFGDVAVRMDLDFINLSGYSLIWSGMSGPPITVGDSMRAQSIRAKPPKVDWIAIRGNGRVLVQTIAPTSDLELLDRRLYYNDNPDTPDPPERIRGENPGIGYRITGWENLSSGEHQLLSMLIGANADYDPALLLKEYVTRPQVVVRSAH